MHYAKQQPTTRTISGLYMDSHIPCRLGEHVPATTKSLVNTGAPSRSIPMEGKGGRECFCIVICAREVRNNYPVYN